MQSVLEVNAGRTVLKMVVSMVIMDGRHCQHPIELFHDEGGLSRIAEHFFVCIVMQTDAPEIRTTEAIKLPQVFYSSISIVRRDTSFAETIMALMNYAGTFYEQYGVHLGNAGTKGIAEDTALFDYLPTRSKSTYNRDVCFAQLLIKYKELLELPRILKEDGTTRKTLVSPIWTALCCVLLR